MDKFILSLYQQLLTVKSEIFSEILLGIDHVEWSKAKRILSMFVWTSANERCPVFIHLICNIIRCATTYCLTVGDPHILINDVMSWLWSIISLYVPCYINISKERTSLSIARYRYLKKKRLGSKTSCSPCDFNECDIYSFKILFTALRQRLSWLYKFI